MQRKTVSTDGVPRERCVEFWNAAATDALAEQHAQPADPGSFRGRIVRADIGEVRAVELSSGAVNVHRSHAHIARSTRAFFLLRLQLAGESLNIQGDRQCRLRAGDFTLCDVSRPYEVIFGRSATVLSLRVDQPLLLRFIGHPRALVHVPMSGTHGPGVMTSRLLREFWGCADSVLASAGVADRVPQFLMELLACAYASQPEARTTREPPGSVLRIQAMEFIETRLGDPELGPMLVAQGIGVSARYVHQLFSDQEQTVCRYIQRRRLEMARAALIDPHRAERSITDIALEFGFKTLAHFSRCFGAEFGQGPREFRLTQRLVHH
jgi:AraC-like DNA-binding protein